MEQRRLRPSLLIFAPRAIRRLSSVVWCFYRPLFRRCIPMLHIFATLLNAVEKLIRHIRPRCDSVLFKKDSVDTAGKGGSPTPVEPRHLSKNDAQYYPLKIRKSQSRQRRKHWCVLSRVPKFDQKCSTWSPHCAVQAGVLPWIVARV